MSAQSRPVAVRTHEILNYFGKCPACGYPARATEARGMSPRGEVDITVTANCDLPCGWSGPVPLTIMT
ncbi:hypothetical protein [Nocardia bovistercoris]|uniref:Uncharacterized protein n=1 Tax=Nocardia bovistercoris TaxID=2785916 RepID=A0A931ID25_9NOCA|nr:hypothetical protein [Nocardia bovistercoris]MBH0779189.1 hypothetical protein [Nocardia bovistercoris]